VALLCGGEGRDRWVLVDGAVFGDHNTGLRRAPVFLEVGPEVWAIAVGRVWDRVTCTVCSLDRVVRAAALSDVLSDDLVEVVRVLLVLLVCARWVVIGVLRCRELAAEVREISREFAVVAGGGVLLVLAVCFVVGFGLQLFACFCGGENKSACEAHRQVRVRGGGASPGDRRPRPEAAKHGSGPRPDLTLVNPTIRYSKLTCDSPLPLILLAQSPSNLLSLVCQPCNRSLRSLCLIAVLDLDAILEEAMHLHAPQHVDLLLPLGEHDIARECFGIPRLLKL
jgi:hypothetical protein